MTYSLEEKVKQFAICTRVGVVLLQFFCNLLIPDHDAGVFQKPMAPNTPKTQLDFFIELTLGGLTRWDGQYYLHIAHYGYTYENTLAFFPLFPLIIRQLSYFVSFIINEILSPLMPVENILSTQSSLVLVSVLLNNFIFVQTAKILFELSVLVLKSEKLAFISAILFCVNPASIFFSAVYSESLYSFLLFYGLLQLEKKNALINYIIIGMTGAVRSNGLVNLGFIAYKYLKIKFTSKTPFFYHFVFLFGIILAALPFAGYQFYCYIKFCFPAPNPVVLPNFIYSYGISKDFVFPGNITPWCNRFLPFAYTYVQKHYWNVDFLNYYQIKQIPNFLLAAPIIYIVARGTLQFVRHYKGLILYLGFVEEDSGGEELPISALPYVLHGIFLTVFSILVIHVQVVTRLLASSTPLPYWYCARALSSSLEKSVESQVLNKLKFLRTTQTQCYHECSKTKKSKWKTFLFSESFCGYSLFIKWYFLIYLVLGTLMFSNYLPWT